MCFIIKYTLINGKCHNNYNIQLRSFITCYMGMGIGLTYMTKVRELQARGIRAFTSDKSQMHMLQVLCNTLLP